MIVNSHKGPYEVKFTEDFQPILSSELRPSDVLMIDENVSRLYSDRLAPLLKEHRYHLVRPSEEAKSYQGVETFIDRLIESGFRKNHRLAAMGGGITQDITAFIASILYRGVEWLFIPTTLLAQCDSCIGSKTSINFGPYKNQLGGFYPPKMVIIDPSLLQTLPRSEFRSGMGEMLHYFLISGRKDFDRISLLYDDAFTKPNVLQELICRSLAIKRQMVELDEFDTGPRHVFNYGHSFGHAIESYTEYSVPHGIAVSFGMDMANQLSTRLGYLDSDSAESMRRLLRRNWLPDVIHMRDLSVFLDLLRKDKKNVDQDIRLILSKGLGAMFVAKVRVDDIFLETLKQCFDYYSTMAKVA